MQQLERILCQSMLLLFWAPPIWTLLKARTKVPISKHVTIWVGLYEYLSSLMIFHCLANTSNYINNPVKSPILYSESRLERSMISLHKHMEDSRSYRFILGSFSVMYLFCPIWVKFIYGMTFEQKLSNYEIWFLSMNSSSSEALLWLFVGEL